MGPDIRYSMQKFVELNSHFKEIKFFTQCNVVLADVHGVLLKPFHEADRENNVVHHVRHRNGDHFI